MCWGGHSRVLVQIVLAAERSWDSGNRGAGPGTLKGQEALLRGLRLGQRGKGPRPCRGLGRALPSRGHPKITQ